MSGKRPGRFGAAVFTVLVVLIAILAGGVLMAVDYTFRAAGRVRKRFRAITRV
jgi:hypothetical protein